VKIVEELNMSHPWHKRDGESEQEYMYFTWYLELGPERKITRIPELYPDGPSLTRLNKLSSDYEWIKRAGAYDEYQVVQRRKKYEERLDIVRDQEFTELEEAFKTSHVLRERIQNDKNSSTYSLLNAWKNWVDAHSKITEDMHNLAGISMIQEQRPQIQAWEQTETHTVTDQEKIQEVTKALRMIQQ